MLCTPDVQYFLRCTAVFELANMVNWTDLSINQSIRGRLNGSPSESVLNSKKINDAVQCLNGPSGVLVSMRERPSQRDVY